MAWRLSAACSVSTSSILRDSWALVASARRARLGGAAPGDVSPSLCCRRNGSVCSAAAWCQRARGQVQRARSAAAATRASRQGRQRRVVQRPRGVRRRASEESAAQAQVEPDRHRRQPVALHPLEALQRACVDWPRAWSSIAAATTRSTCSSGSGAAGAACARCDEVAAENQVAGAERRDREAFRSLIRPRPPASAAGAGTRSMSGSASKARSSSVRQITRLSSRMLCRRSLSSRLQRPIP